MNRVDGHCVLVASLNVSTGVGTERLVLSYLPKLDIVLAFSSAEANNVSEEWYSIWCEWWLLCIVDPMD